MEVKKKFLLIILAVFSLKAFPHDFDKLKVAYPNRIREVTGSYITWNDGMQMVVRNPFSSIVKWFGNTKNRDFSMENISYADFINNNCDPFFRKMYGNTESEVRKNLVTIYWMSNIYGKRYPLRVTTVNDVDKRLMRISEALEKLPRAYHKYVIKPASGFYWRNVAKEKYLSLHSFGIAIDINVNYSNYWLWDLQKLKGKTIPHLHNRIPMEIVEIFEKEGFAWGGHWYHYDTMHFEYRPELFV